MLSWPHFSWATLYIRTVACVVGQVELVAWSTVSASSTHERSDRVLTDLIIITRRHVVITAFINICSRP